MSRAKYTDNFYVHEFACPCCGESKMDPEFMRDFQALRTEWGRSIKIVEGGGYRCKNYDPKQGAHGAGVAADPGIERHEMHEFLALAFKHGFRGIGAKQKKGRWQVHIDQYEGDDKRPRPWFWTY